MRIAFSALLLLLLALAALAGNGCKRGVANPASPTTSFTRMVHVVQAHPLVQQRAEPSHPAFVFCHPRADQLDDASLTAVEAQIVFDLKANNDDRTEMIAADFERADVHRLPQPQVALARQHRDSVWPAVLERPPRRTTAALA